MIWFLHGNLGCPADGHAVMQRLEAAGYETRSPDLWEILSETPLSLKEAGQQLAKQILQEDPAPILCGYSMGARIALHAIPHLPHCTAIILCGVNPGLKNKEERQKRMEHDQRWADELRRSEWTDFYQKWTSQAVFTEGKNNLRLSPNKRNRELMARAFECWSLGKQEDGLPALQHSTAPLLLITGERDLKFTKIAEALIHTLSKGKHLILPSSGHRIFEDSPAALSQLILDFLTTLKNHE